jgi:hypothetical protein
MPLSTVLSIFFLSLIRIVSKPTPHGIAGLTHLRRRHADTDADVPGMAKTFRINSQRLSLLLVPTARL